jgi:hypothetical protein
VPDNTKPKATIRWNQRELITLPIAAQVLGCSVGQIYSLAHRGEIDLVNLGRRTLARTRSIVGYRAPPWVSAQHRTAKALASRTAQRQSAKLPLVNAPTLLKRESRISKLSRVETNEQLGKAASS